MAKEGEGREGHGFTKQFKDMYHAYFPTERVNTTARWLPKRCCNTCYATLSRWWTQGPEEKTKTKMSFIMPIRWPLLDPLEHKREECYGCKNHDEGLTKEKRKLKRYVAVGAVSLPVPYVEGMTVPKKPSPDFFSVTGLTSVPGGFSPEFSEWQPSAIAATTSKQPKPLTKEDLDTIVAILALPKTKSEELASFLKHRNLLAPGVNATSFRTRMLS